MMTKKRLETMVKQAVLEECKTGPQGNSANSTDITYLPVNLNTDDRINEFAKQIISWTQQNQVSDDILAGKVRFTLSNINATTTSKDAHPSSHLEQQKGVVSEAWLKHRITPGINHIIIGKSVVVTPSAVDLMSQLKLTIERLEQ